MNAETFLYPFVIVLIVITFGVLFSIELSEEEPVQIDYSERFNNLESDHNQLKTGIINSTLDVCFQSGGQWLTDNNALRWVDLTEEVETSFCVRPKKPKT